MLKSFTAQNHLDPTGPFYSGHFAVEEPQPGASLSVISYNIAYGKKLGLAGFLLRRLPEVEPVRVARARPRQLGPDR